MSRTLTEPDATEYAHELFLILADDGVSHRYNNSEIAKMVLEKYPELTCDRKRVQSWSQVNRGFGKTWITEFQDMKERAYAGVQQKNLATVISAEKVIERMVSNNSKASSINEQFLDIIQANLNRLAKEHTAEGDPEDIRNIPIEVLNQSLLGMAILPLQVEKHTLNGLLEMRKQAQENRSDDEWGGHRIEMVSANLLPKEEEEENENQDGIGDVNIEENQGEEG